MEREASGCNIQVSSCAQSLECTSHLENWQRASLLTLIDELRVALVLHCCMLHSHYSNTYQLSFVETKKRAIQAAAAKAIDSFMSQGEFKRCYDISIMLSSGPVLPQFPYSIAIQLKKKRLRSGRWANVYENINVDE